MAISCDLTDLMLAAKTYQETGIGTEQREAIALFAAVESLAAAGGADYTADLTALQEAAKEYQIVAPIQREAIDLAIRLQNALDSGAEFSTDINDLNNLAKCYLCLSSERRKQLLLFLKCALSNLGIPS